MLLSFIYILDILDTGGASPGSTLLHSPLPPGDKKRINRSVYAQVLRSLFINVYSLNLAGLQSENGL